MEITVMHMNRNETTGDVEGFTPVAIVDASDLINHGTEEMMEYAYRYTNNVTGSWSKKIGNDANDDVTVLTEREDGLGLRSTMMFDRLEMAGIVYEVGTFGFKELGYIEEVA